LNICKTHEWQVKVKKRWRSSSERQHKKIFPFKPITPDCITLHCHNSITSADPDWKWCTTISQVKHLIKQKMNLPKTSQGHSSKKQSKRLNRISRRHNWSQRQLSHRKLITSFGYCRLKKRLQIKKIRREDWKETNSPKTSQGHSNQKRWRRLDQINLINSQSESSNDDGNKGKERLVSNWLKEEQIKANWNKMIDRKKERETVKRQTWLRVIS
jgi:hypothetical protein